MNSRRAIADSVFSENKMNVEKLTGEEHSKMLKEFKQTQNWYRAAEVDKLSLEEAEIIAERLVKRINARVSLSQKKMQALKRDFTNLFKSRLTQSYTSEINSNENKAVETIQHKTIGKLLKIGKKYLGEKEMLILKDAVALGYRPLPQEENEDFKKGELKEEISEVIISVKEMTSYGCEFSVENAIKKLNDIIQAKADYQKGEVYVKFERGKVTVDDILEAINKTEYKATKP